MGILLLNTGQELLLALVFLGLIEEVIFGSVVSGIGMFLLWKKLPKRVQNFALKHPLFADIFTSFGAFCLFGGGVTALFTGATVALMADIALYVKRNEKDFQWLDDLISQASGKMKEYLEQAREWSKTKNEAWLEERARTGNLPK